MKTTFRFTLLTLFACLSFYQIEAQRTHFFPQKTQQHLPANSPQLHTPQKGGQIAERGGSDLRLIGERTDFWENSWIGYDSVTYSYTNNRLAEIISRDFNGTDWKPRSRSLYEYDANGNNTRYLNQVWDSTDWADEYQVLSTYNASNQLTESISQLWNINSWLDLNRQTYSYDANGNEIESISQFWTTGNWENSSRETHAYDANNRLTVSTSQYWAGIMWTNFYRSLYTYDMPTNTTTITEQEWNGMAWISQFRYVLESDTDEKLLSETEQMWDGTAWENTTLTTYTYNAGGRVTLVLEKEWNGAAWDNYSQNINEYDPNDKWVSYLLQYWDAGAWINFTYVTIDEAGFFPEEDPVFGSLFNKYVLQYWNDSLNDWTNDLRYFGYFETFVGVKNVANSFDLQVYPNPTTGTVTLNVADTDIQPQRMMLLDMHGRQLMSRRLQGVGTEQLNLGQLPKGQYLLLVHDKRGRTSTVPVQMK